MGNDPRIEKLRLRLTGTRQKAQGTINNYMQTATRFLDGLNKQDFDSTDIDLYIARRRDAGISERTLRTEFFGLKRLCLANGVEWPFTREDRPTPKEGPKKTFLKPDQIDQIIMHQGEYSKAERFYLAISTTWACRREAMAQINKRDFNEKTILIKGVHRSLPVTHLIPEEIKPVLLLDWAGEHSTGSLSQIFNRICLKAELELPDDGYGWHSIRRTLTSLFANLLPKNRLAPSIWAEYTGWSKQAKGRYFMESAMMGEYSDTAGVSDDPYTVDRQIYAIHPFLRTWAAALAGYNKAPEVQNTDTPLLEILSSTEKLQETVEELSPLDIRLQELRKRFGSK